ncbi:hypothetical protein BY996DRAFT_7524173, partial [Phakopsora pachyrhizi]
MSLKTTGVLFLKCYLNLYHFFFIYISKKQMRACQFQVLSGSFFCFFVIFFLYLYFKKSN